MLLMKQLQSSRRHSFDKKSRLSRTQFELERAYESTLILKLQYFDLKLLVWLCHRSAYVKDRDSQMRLFCCRMGRPRRGRRFLLFDQSQFHIFGKPSDKAARKQHCSNLHHWRLGLKLFWDVIILPKSWKRVHHILLSL